MKSDYEFAVFIAVFHTLFLLWHYYIKYGRKRQGYPEIEKIAQMKFWTFNSGVIIYVWIGKRNV